MPSTPTRLIATAQSAYEVEVAWSSPGTDTAFFEVERGVSGSPYTLIYTAPSYQTLYHNTGLTPATEYCYRVRAGNGTTYSNYSGEACATTDTLATTGQFRRWDGTEEAWSTLVLPNTLANNLILATQSPNIVSGVPLGANLSFVSGSLTASVTGGIVSGSGIATRIAEWADSTTLQSSTLIKTGAGVLTLSSAGAYTATVPETMILAGRNVANTFTTTQTIYAVQPELWLDGSGVPLRSVVFATSGSGRWYLRANNTAESGANAGSDFVILARNDSGGAIGTALTITRSSMAAAFAGNLSTSLSTNGALLVSVNNANTGASASARFRATSDVVTADYTAFPAAAAGGARLNLTSAGGYMLIGTTTNDRIDFYTNNTLRATIAAAGGLSLVGKVSTYNNVATEGYGVPSIVDDVALTNQGADIAATNFTNAGTVGEYEVSLYTVVTTADATAGSITVSFLWNDGTAARSPAASIVNMAATNCDLGVVTLRLHLGSGNIQYQVTHTGNYGTAKYALYMTCKRVN